MSFAKRSYLVRTKDTNDLGKIFTLVTVWYLLWPNPVIGRYFDEHPFGEADTVIDMRYRQLVNPFFDLIWIILTWRIWSVNKMGLHLILQIKHFNYWKKYFKKRWWLFTTKIMLWFNIDGLFSKIFRTQSTLDDGRIGYRNVKNWPKFFLLNIMMNQLKEVSTTLHKRIENLDN